MALNIANQIATLQRMTVGQLREKYEDVFGESTRAGNKDFLFKRIVWRLQSLAEGTLSERARQRAARIACEADIRTTIPRPPKISPGGECRTTIAPAPMLGDARLPIVGTVLMRDYRGRTINVTVMPEGFEYDGQVYKTLTAVAKVVTGSHWNGYLFFGLAKPGRKVES
jgi:hypothetical protein